MRRLVCAGDESGGCRQRGSLAARVSTNLTSGKSATPDEAWWRNAVIYEIAVISFCDGNGDGQGDLPGLLQRIDYIKWLGAGAVWLTPIFTSPNLDFGYDIADFCAIDPRYGTIEDFERVRDALHDSGIKLILDFVPNHTSDQHPWFIESR